MYVTRATPKIVAIDLDCGEDPFYRYKTRQLKIIDNGNARTFFENIKDVSKDLNILPSFLPKFLAIELGTSSGFEKGRNLWYIAGSHSTNSIHEKLSVFIRGFVLCKTCGQPELSYEAKRGKVLMSCRGCGETTYQNEHEKFCKFMVKELR
ncbi:eukaryotic translation initiation factor 5 [Marseillevirus marseillevirus]|uniref:Eukaryotic translation initiation factor 5 n=1 Tax=Marseillevirus marseillevirus TaxID=694581 RepID=D2XAU9_GBMV|nr:eukaryotic translation initiation factor 5 [Marseillevirus marseillevirus]ADB04076.1 eukaryotic translation initiation factor 5 [Marseillevirus marseillevirus]